MTQEKAILDYLKKGNSLTSLEALKRFGTLRLGARAYDLKQKGHNIKSERVKRNGKIVARYSLGAK